MSFGIKKLKNAAALYTLCRAAFISHLWYPHNVWQDIVSFFSFVTNSSLTASISGCRGRQPLHQSSTAAKLLSLFADFTLYKRTQKAVQSFHSDTALSFVLYLVLVIYSVWLCHSSLLTPHFNREVYPRSYPASRPRLLLSHHYRKLSQTSGL